jgi:molybdate-binding protein
MKLLCVLYSHDVLYVLYDTNRMAVAARIAADGADVAVADVMAHAAMFDITFHDGNRLRQSLHVVSVLA